MKHIIRGWEIQVLLKVFQVLPFKLLELYSFQVTAFTHPRPGRALKPSDTAVKQVDLDWVTIKVSVKFLGILFLLL